MGDAQEAPKGSPVQEPQAGTPVSPAAPHSPPQGARFIPSAQDIKQASDIQTEDVPVPEWGPGAVLPIRGLTGKERDAYEATITETKGGTQQLRIRNARAKLVVLAAVNDQGGRLFSDDDIGWLGQKSARALGRLFDKARELSGMTDQDIEELEEQLGKDRSG